jgi:hypothetical protein
MKKNKGFAGSFLIFVFAVVFAAIFLLKKFESRAYDWYNIYIGDNFIDFVTKVLTFFKII